MDMEIFFKGNNIAEEPQNPIEKCPFCSDWFPVLQTEMHVENCSKKYDDKNVEMASIDNMYDANSFDVQEDLRFARRLQEEEEKSRKKEEEENERLLKKFLEEEKRRALSSSTILCECCTNNYALENIHFIDNCQHSFCKGCLRNFLLGAISRNKCIDLVCPKLNCRSVFPIQDIKELLTKNEFEQYEKVTIKELVASKSDQFVHCPKESCSYVMERLLTPSSACLPSSKKSCEKRKRSKTSMTILKNNEETGLDGKPLSEEYIRERDLNRFRCRECGTEFCAQCSSIPYHNGFTCAQFFLDKKAKHCRFCNVQLSLDNTAEVLKEVPALCNVCNSEDCLLKRDQSCAKIHIECGHPCIGVRDELKCPPCIHVECFSSDDMNVSNEQINSQIDSDYCNICWVEELQCAPTIQLDCGHFFHYSCVKKKIGSLWSTSRITFGFLQCDLCKKPMSHPLLEKDLEPIRNLYEEVKRKGLDRLKMMNLLQCKELTSQGSNFFNDPAGLALYQFCYYLCYKCKKPYYGGERVCDAINNEEFDPKELICGSCSDFIATENCAKHGKEYIEYKCRFCCNVSAWFCFGTTHFCDECHKKAHVLTTAPKTSLPKCSCNIKHPPNGEEFLLGCSLCRIQQSSLSEDR